MFDPRSRSALRKCMLMEMPPRLVELIRELPPAPTPIAAWTPPPKERPIVAHRRDPKKDVRLMPAYRPGARASDRRIWWEEPVALGALLIVAPPIGLACLWSSKRYTIDARWALTVMSALITCFAGAIALAFLVLR